MTWARTLGKYRDGRRNNGGARKGAGRPISSAERLMIEEHLMSEITVKEFRHGQHRWVKKPTIVAILDKLFEMSKQGDVSAMKAYFNLTLGRPATPRGNKPRYRKKTVTRAMAQARIF